MIGARFELKRLREPAHNLSVNRATVTSGFLDDTLPQPIGKAEIELGGTTGNYGRFHAPENIPAIHKLNSITVILLTSVQRFSAPFRTIRWLGLPCVMVCPLLFLHPKFEVVGLESSYACTVYPYSGMMQGYK